MIWPLVGVALTVVGDYHGPPLLLGFGLGALLLWRDRRRHPERRPAAEAAPGPRP